MDIEKLKEWIRRYMLHMWSMDPSKLSPAERLKFQSDEAIIRDFLNWVAEQ